MARHRLIGCSMLLALFVSCASAADDDQAELEHARNETTKQLKEIGIAMLNHHDTFKKFPPPAFGREGKPLLSWRVKLLPFLEHNPLYMRFHLDEPWDSENNIKLLEEMPDVYCCPRSKAAEQNRTVYQVPRGANTIFPPEGTSLRTIRDGTSNTIMLVETDEEHAVPWTKPDDWTFDPEKPGAGLAGHFPQAFFVGAADASVHELPITIDTNTLRALFTRDGREQVKFPEIDRADSRQPADPEAMARATAETIDQFKQIGIALHNFHDVRKSFPAPAISQEGKPLLSWRVALLPFFEDDESKNVSLEFHFDEPWNSEHNKALVAKMPKVYRCPLSKVGDRGRTVYLAPRGNSTIFSGPEGVSIRKVSDGLSNTIAVVEVDDKHAVEWTRPDDWKFDPARPSAGLGGHVAGRLMFLFADGSVHMLRDTIDKDILKGLFTHNGGEVIAIPND